MSRFALVMCLVLAMGACASTNIPEPDTSEAESMIKQAEEAGAQEYAAVELREAREKVEQEENEKAMRLTEEASVDAELAMVKAHSAKAQEAVKQLQETIKTLKKEIERNKEKQGGSQ